jgi:hypothetical protein
MTTGIELITEERKRQIEAENWSSKHDDGHKWGELALAAMCYAHPLVNKKTGVHLRWPWFKKWWKPSNDPIRNLTKAGALIAAEIDRLLRIAHDTTNHV